MHFDKHLPMFQEEPKYEVRHICSLRSLKIEKYSAESDGLEVIESHLSGRVIGKNSKYFLEGEGEYPVEQQEAQDLAMLMPFSPMTRRYKIRL